MRNISGLNYLLKTFSALYQEDTVNDINGSNLTNKGIWPFLLIMASSRVLDVDCGKSL